MKVRGDKMEQKIPKVIHFCWFGHGEYPELIVKCMETWKKYLPEYEIVKWSEDNFDINSNQYVKEAYENKKWAFVTDYVRLYALYTCGGIYLDSDVEILKPIDEFLDNEAFSGFESKDTVPTAIMGAVKGVSTALSSYTVSKLGATGGTSTTKEVKTRRNKKTGRQYKFSTRTVESVFDASNYQYGNAIEGAFECATDSLNNMHISASTDRSNNPTTMINTCKSIKVIRYYPKIIATNSDYGKLYGYPLGQTKVLSTLSGYTEISNIHIEGEGFKSATQKEILMLKEALSDGIIL